MSKVTLYTTKLCPYCVAAKRLLTGKGVSFEEIDVTFNPQRRADMMQKANGRHTVPQIFVGSTHVGGYDDLAAMDRDGKLDPLLAR